jgi:acetyl-CoA C-acetyltransferase
MPQNVAVIGVGETPFRSHIPEKTYVELAQDAAHEALIDSGLTPDDIDCVVFSMAPTTFMGVNDADKWAVDHIWAAGKPFMRIHTGGATGGSAFHGGYFNVASGRFRTCLVVGADRISETPDAQHVLNLIWDRFYEHDFALNTVTMTAMMAQRYQARHGSTEEQAARVVVRARRNAMNNPNAHLKGEITVDDVMASRMISTPFKLYDICPRSAGGAAVVLACEEEARARCTQPAFIQGIGGIATTVFMGDRMVPTTDCEISEFENLAIAGRECYQRAKVSDPMREIQVAELYDPFSYMQFPKLEALGFCRRGEAARLCDEGVFDMDGQVAVNPSGGTLCTNPIGVSGLVRVADAAKQVMGRAGDMQVPNVKRALATAVGGSAQFFAVSVLGQEPI